jgi:hypothetical protein
MATAFSFVLAVGCIAIVATALGLVAAAWTTTATGWGQRIARGTAVTVGVAFVLLAALHPVGEATGR